MRIADHVGVELVPHKVSATTPYGNANVAAAARFLRSARPCRGLHPQRHQGIFVLIGGIIAALVCGLIAKTRGYSALLFAVLGFFFSIITLIVVLVIPRKR